VRHRADEVTGYLNVNTESKKEVGVKEDTDNQKAKRFIEIQRVPEDVRVRILQAPFDKRSYSVVHGKPQAENQIGPFVDPRYFFKYFQAGKFIIIPKPFKTKPIKKILQR